MADTSQDTEFRSEITLFVSVYRCSGQNPTLTQIQIQYQCPCQYPSSSYIHTLRPFVALAILYILPSRGGGCLCQRRRSWMCVSGDGGNNLSPGDGDERSVTNIVDIIETTHKTKLRRSRTSKKRGKINTIPRLSKRKRSVTRQLHFSGVRFE